MGRVSAGDTGEGAQCYRSRRRPPGGRPTPLRTQQPPLHAPCTASPRPHLHDGAQDRRQVVLRVQLQALAVDVAVEVDREARDAQDGAVDADEARVVAAAAAAHDGAASDGEVAVQPGVPQAACGGRSGARTTVGARAASIATSFAGSHWKRYNGIRIIVSLQCSRRNRCTHRRTSQHRRTGTPTSTALTRASRAGTASPCAPPQS